MAESKKKTVKTAKRAAAGPDPEAGKREERTKRARFIEGLLERMEEKLAEEAKGSLADFLRLLQFQKEFEQESPREIEVRWVEPGEEESSSDG